MFQTVLSFDMRAPSFGAPSEELYAAALEMCAFGDEIGIDGVIFPEHHCSEDGYNPVPSLMATAVAARTKKMAIILGAIVLPLHDPVVALSGQHCLNMPQAKALARAINGGQ